MQNLTAMVENQMLIAIILLVFLFLMIGLISSFRKIKKSLFTRKYLTHTVITFSIILLFGILVWTTNKSSYSLADDDNYGRNYDSINVGRDGPVIGGTLPDFGTDTTTTGGNIGIGIDSASNGGEITPGDDGDVVTAQPPPPPPPPSRQIDPEFIKGLIAVSVTEEMQVGETYIAEAAITSASDTQILTRGIDTQNVHIESIQVSSRMEMTLTDPTDENFRIKDLNSTRQGVSQRQNTVWRWGVVPLNKGENILVMTAKVIITDGEETTNYDIPVYDRYIVVKSTLATDFSRFLSRNWQFFTPLVFIPLIMWGRRKVGEYITQKKKAKEPKTAEKQVGFLVGKPTKNKDVTPT